MSSRVALSLIKNTSKKTLVHTSNAGSCILVLVVLGEMGASKVLCLELSLQPDNEIKQVDIGTRYEGNASACSCDKMMRCMVVG